LENLGIFCYALNPCLAENHKGKKILLWLSMRLHV